MSTKLLRDEVGCEQKGGQLSAPFDIEDQKVFWGNAKPPSTEELAWIKSFGRYPGFDPRAGKISERITLSEANLKDATRIIVVYHYLHRGRTMAQLPYWIEVDGATVGVLLYSLPRLSVPICGIRPMNLLELARMWLSPDVQGFNVQDSNGKSHALSIASCAVSQSYRRARVDWFRKYPNLPDISAVVSWADNVHHEGTIYRACNFAESGQSGGSLHGGRHRPNGGRDKLNPDYAHTKTMFLYRFKTEGLSESAKRKILAQANTGHRAKQLSICVTED